MNTELTSTPMLEGLIDLPFAEQVRRRQAQATATRERRLQARQRYREQYRHEPLRRKSIVWPSRSTAR